jgi:hypothetical protein
MLHIDGIMVSNLFPAADISVTALSVAAAINLVAAIPHVETKMTPTTMTMVTMYEMHHGTIGSIPVLPPSMTSAIAAVNAHHHPCHIVHNDNCQKPAVFVHH